MSPAFGDPGEAQAASPVSSAVAVSDPNQVLADATQNLVRALVQSVRQEADPNGAYSNGAYAIEPVRPDGGKPVPPKASHWSLSRDEQLQAALTRWCDKAGWTLVWHSEYGYRIEAVADFDGDFVSVVSALFAAMKDVSPPIYPEIYKGNRVVVVKNNPSH